MRAQDQRTSDRLAASQVIAPAALRMRAQTAAANMYWDKKLTYTITPKSGPMRSMETLLDVNHALSQDLPMGYLKRRHWLDAGKIVVEAAETGSIPVIREATERLLSAVETEGWMNRTPRQAAG
jgi:hypothetical protein